MDTKTVSDWQPIETAPKDGTWIQAKIDEYDDIYIIAWQADFLDDDEKDCGGWCCMTEEEAPDCWTAGVCWSVNADGYPSKSPVHWKLLLKN